MDYDIKIKAFKAIDNLDLCQQYSEKYAEVLRSYGINSKTMIDTSWYDNPNVYAIVAQDKNSGKMIGGARIEVKSPKYLLPVEEAVGEIDPNIYDFMRPDSSSRKVGELCRVWNVREVSGVGLSAIVIVSTVAEAGIVIAKRLQLKALSVLAAPWTLSLFKKVGFSVETSLGNNGTFNYPRPGLEATVMFLSDITDIKNAQEIERENIKSLRLNPRQIKAKQGLNGNLNVEFDL